MSPLRQALSSDLGTLRNPAAVDHQDALDGIERFIDLALDVLEDPAVAGLWEEKLRTAYNEIV